MICKSKSILNLIFFVIIAMFAIIGCGENEVVAPDLNPIVTIDSIATVSGTIDVSEIGGAGLTVLTAWNDSAISNVDSSGVFDASVSSINSQLMFVVDENDQLRGLGISIPDTIGSANDELSLDATSTVVGLLMFTPGIIALDPLETSNRIAELKQFSDFNSMVNLLKSRMPFENLEDIIASSTFNILYENTVNAWIDSYQADSVSAKRLGVLSAEVLGNRGFKITTPDLIYGNLEVKLASYSWRYVKVNRQAIGTDNEPVGEPELIDIAMKGGVRGSYSSFYSTTFGAPTTKLDNFIIGASECPTVNPVIAKYDYWILGPGNIPPDIIMPDYISKDYSDATFYTVMRYIVDPILKLMMGKVKSEGMTQDFLKQIYNNAKIQLTVKSLTDAVEAGDNSKARRELSSLIHTSVTTIAKMTSNNSDILTLAKISKMYLRLLTGLDFLVEGLNLTVVMTHWMNNSWAYKITVEPKEIISDVRFLPEFNDNIIKLNRGESFKLNAHAYNELGQSIDFSEDLLLWSYENSEFVEFVDGDNSSEIIINAKKDGSSSISIQEDNWCNSDKYTIEINGVKSLKVTPSDILNITVGKDQFLVVEALDLNGIKLTEIDPSYFEWSIQDNSIVNLGLLQGITVPMKAVKEGSTVITVTETLSGKKANIIVTVKEENIIESLRINPSVNLSLFAGANLNISVDALDINHSVVVVDPTSFEWSVLNASIVSLSSNTGNQLELNGLSLGETQITVTEKTSGKSISATVTVKAQELSGGSWDWFVNDAKDNSTLYIYSNNTMKWQYNVVSHSGTYIVNGNQIEFDKTQVYLGNTYYLLDCVGTINATVDTISGTCTSPATGDYIGTFKAIRR